MVAGKVKNTVGFQRSPAYPKPDPPPTTTKLHQKGSAAAFSRSFGVYFPRASAQVQPPPPDEVTELLQLVEQLRERESRLQTQLLEQKVVVESSAFVPVFEDDNITKQNKKIECLEMENMALRQEVESLHCKLSEQRRRSDEKMKAMEILVSDLKHNVHHVSFLSNTIIKNSNAKKNVVFLDKCNNIARNNKDEDYHKTEREKDIEEALAENVESIITTTERSCRVARIPKPPPPKRLLSLSSLPPCLDGPVLAEASVIPAPAKTAPPPPPVKGGGGKVRRVPEVVEFYHSLMRRDSRRDSGGGAAVANARDMIGEIENRSAYLTAIKTDVETQGDFIRFLIKEVESATFTDIQDVVSFVKWLDDELSYLMDERAVLKHFQWPEQKADTLREAAFGYCDLKKLESEASSFRDDNRHSCAVALKKMQALFEKLEHGVYNMSRTRESAAKRYKGFHIPMDWMLDSGCVSQIKLASVKLAMKYMKRVSAELKTGNGCPEEEELIVQGVRFAFRVHQFAGGFDEETMRAFQELREKARSCNIQCQNQKQKKDVCRPFGY